MTPEDIQKWQPIFEAKAGEIYPASDPSHDILHIRRVVKTALQLAEEEQADRHVVLPAAYFHDFINVPKDDPRRKQASQLSAEAAIEYLTSVGYPAAHFDAISHAIAAHSFSAGIKPETLEARVVQDADRLDALGAIGIARCFTINGKTGRPYYDPEDFMAESREADDQTYAIDHFFVKLLRLPELMQTDAARAEANRRVGFMRQFLDEMYRESKK